MFSTSPIRSPSIPSYIFFFAVISAGEYFFLIPAPLTSPPSFSSSSESELSERRHVETFLSLVLTNLLLLLLPAVVLLTESPEWHTD